MRSIGILLGLSLLFVVFVVPAQAGPPDCCCGTDTDGDTHFDLCDNCLLVANPDQTDSDGDGCGNRCDPDFNQDGVVGAADFAVLAVNYGSAVPPAAAYLDIGPDPLDGIVGAADFSKYASTFGGVPGPSGTTAGTTACP